MEKRFKLKVEDVLNKQFNIDFKGYSSVEVDEFLDLVINDYQAVSYTHLGIFLKKCFRMPIVSWSIETLLNCW